MIVECFAQENSIKSSRFPAPFITAPLLLLLYSTKLEIFQKKLCRDRSKFPTIAALLVLVAYTRNPPVLN